MADIFISDDNRDREKRGQLPSKQREYAKRYREKHRAEINARRSAKRAANIDAFRAKDREAKRLKRQQMSASPPEVREAYVEKTRRVVARYYQENKERLSQCQKARWEQRSEEERERERQRKRVAYQENPSRQYLATMKWLASNPEWRRADGSRRRTSRDDTAFTKEDVKRIFTAQRAKCAMCRTSVRQKYEVDHIKPLSKGGTNDPRNIQLLCVKCNRSKHAKDPLDFARQRGLLL